MSNFDASTSIAPTITPARYTNSHMLWHRQSHPVRCVGLSYFFTSTKTAVGVLEVFAYVGRDPPGRDAVERTEAYASGPNLVRNGSTGTGMACVCARGLPIDLSIIQGV